MSFIVAQCSTSRDIVSRVEPARAQWASGVTTGRNGLEAKGKIPKTDSRAIV